MAPPTWLILTCPRRLGTWKSSSVPMCRRIIFSWRPESAGAASRTLSRASLGGPLWDPPVKHVPRNDRWTWLLPSATLPWIVMWSVTSPWTPWMPTMVLQRICQSRTDERGPSWKRTRTLSMAGLKYQYCGRQTLRCCQTASSRPLAPKMAKGHLSGLIGSGLVSDFELQTLFVEVEEIMNSRTITPVSSDQQYLEALTPNHLLLQRKVLRFPLGIFVKEDCLRWRRWRKVQLLADCFLKRWLREFLPGLQPRQRNLWATQNVKVGSLVLVVDEQPRGKWHLGRVCAVFQSKDGLVRSAEVRTSSGTLIRPVVKLCLINKGHWTPHTSGSPLCLTPLTSFFSDPSIFCFCMWLFLWEAPAVSVGLTNGPFVGPGCRVSFFSFVWLSFCVPSGLCFVYLLVIVLCTLYPFLFYASHVLICSNAVHKCASIPHACSVVQLFS